MAEFTEINNFRIELDTETKAVDVPAAGGTSVMLKAAASNTVPIYVGRATNSAAAALSASTGWPLAAGEVFMADLTLTTPVPTDGTQLSVFADADNQYVHVIVLSA